jgi:hypothetical protein
MSEALLAPSSILALRHTYAFRWNHKEFGGFFGPQPGCKAEPWLLRGVPLLVPLEPVKNFSGVLPAGAGGLKSRWC